MGYEGLDDDFDQFEGQCLVEMGISVTVDTGDQRAAAVPGRRRRMIQLRTVNDANSAPSQSRVGNSKTGEIESAIKH